MTVEERNGRDQFPVGMRVLAVDDDPTCLKLLETLLLRCRYHVTTTGQAVTALRLLRENKDKFDLVISDVHMPDMDGFKLLELVGLEMDLPVIMLSANSDTKAVMKGITHGACDYLLKPVRIEELKNIWQHVVRRRKFETRDQNNFDNDDSEKPHVPNSEGGQGQVTSGGSDRNGKLNKKRKDQNDEDDNDGGENGQENEDPSTQKKPRVVWSIELHRKFVAAVNQLGIEKAVPKRILDLMNVEGLTRENVASHLQKYRLYLKRLNAVASQQANMVAALRVRDPSFMPIGSLTGFGSCHALAGSGQIPAFKSFQPNGVVGRMNSPNGIGWQRLAPSGMIQFGCTPNDMSNPINDPGKFQGIRPSGYQDGSLLQGVPMSLELDQFQQQKTIHKGSGPIGSGFSSSGVAIGNSTNSLANVTNSPLLLQSNQQHTLSGGPGNHSSVGVSSLSSDPFEIGLGDGSCLPDLSRCNDTLEAAVPLTSCSSSTLPMAGPMSHGHLPSNNMPDDNSTALSRMNGNHHNLPSNNMAATPMQNSVRGGNVQQQAVSLCGNLMLAPMSIAEDSELLDFRSTGNLRHNWEEQKMDHNRGADLMFNSSLNSSLQNHHINDPISDCNNKMNMAMSGQRSFGARYITQHCKIENPSGDGLLKYKDEFRAETMKLQSSFSSNGCSLDDIVNAMIKPEHDDIAFMDGDIGCDIYSLGTCMGNSLV